jgi:DNA-directed RNA polymerase alpha subunit
MTNLLSMPKNVVVLRVKRKVRFKATTKKIKFVVKSIRLAHRPELVPPKPVAPRVIKTVVTPAMKRYLNRPLTDLGLSCKVLTPLESAAICSINDLLHTRPEKLLAIKNLGDKALDEIYCKLSALGFVKPGYETLGRIASNANLRHKQAMQWLCRRLGYYC